MATTTRPFTPVIKPTIRPDPRRPASADALAAWPLLLAREAERRRANRRRLAGGLAVVLGVTVVSLLPVGWLAWVAHVGPRHSILPPTTPAPAVGPVPLFARPPAELVGVVLLVDAALAVLLIPVAALTRKPSRADVADRIMHEGCRARAGRDDPILRFVLCVLAVGLLWGEFLIWDAVQATWVAIRLRSVDRHRAALILGMIRADPAGVDPRLLLRVGERPTEFRRVLAYLVVNEWADLTRRGDRLTAVSPARRALRG